MKRRELFKQYLYSLLEDGVVKVPWPFSLDAIPQLLREAGPVMLADARAVALELARMLAASKLRDIAERIATPRAK